MKTTLLKFLSLFDRKEKLQIRAIFFLMLTGALFETFAIGFIYPYISILKRPEIIQEQWVLRLFYNIMGLKSTKGFLIWSTVGLIIIYLIKNAYLVLWVYIQSRFVFNKRMSFSSRLLTFYLYQPYTFHLQRNTAELLHKITVAVPSLFNGFLLYALMLAIEIVTTVSILCLLIFVKPLPTILAISILSAATFAFYKISKKKVSEFGKLKQHYGEKMFLWINQSLGGLKEIKVLGREKFFINAFEKNSRGYAYAERFMYVINQFSRPFLETVSVLCMLLIVLIIIAQSNEFQSIIPTFSLFAVAAFRIMPSMNRILAAVSVMRYNSYSLEVVYNDLSVGKSTNTNSKTEIRSELPIVFNKEIELRNISYQYPDANKLSLSDISLKIPKYCSVGFVGPSGAGKTTIVDVILGLLIPTQGEVFIDCKNIEDTLPSWQRQIGYIPQSIYLSDDTIRRNIAFGLPNEQIDDKQIWSVLSYAQLEEMVNSLPDKLDTFIGERGVRLSGGQRQRIGIARALYHDPDVLIMDEGTASLDNETEYEIMQAVRRLSGKKTVIIIAHRLSTVKNCDLLFFIKDGKLIDSGTYEELLDKSTEFRTMAMAIGG